MNNIKRTSSLSHNSFEFVATAVGTLWESILMIDVLEIDGTANLLSFYHDNFNQIDKIK